MTEDNSPLGGQALDKILMKEKGKAKQKQTGHARQGTSGYFPAYINAFSTFALEKKPLANGDEMDSELAKKLTFNIALFSVKERSKDFKKKTGKNMYMVLDSNEPFNTWRAQLLVRIEKTLNPSKLDINNYKIHFTIACISPSPLMVSSEEEFANMLERIGKSKDLACNVYVQELRSSDSESSKVVILSILWLCSNVTTEVQSAETR